MRILFSYENVLPTTQADAEVFMNTAAAITRRGHPGILLTPRPPVGEEKSARALLHFFEIEAPLRIETQRTRLIHPIFQFRDHAKELVNDPRARSADLVYTRNLAVIRECLKRSIPVIFEHYRPWGDQFPPLQLLIRRMMESPSFLGMIAHSRFAAASYHRIGIPQEKIAVIHNGYDPKRLTPRPKWEARRALGFDRSAKIITYAGRVNHKKGLEVVLAMARARPDLLFHLVGVERENELTKRARAIPNIRLFPFQPFGALADHLFATDILLIPPSDRPLSRHGTTILPLKLFSYLAVGRPILAPRNGDLLELLRDGENASLARPSDLADILTRLDQLFDDEPFAARLARGAKESGKNLSWDMRAAKIERFIESRLVYGGSAAFEPFEYRRYFRESGDWLLRGLLRGEWIYRPDELEDERFAEAN